LLIDPCIPKSWPGFELAFRYHSTRYEIAVTNPHHVSRGVVSLFLDGESLPAAARQIPLSDEGVTHKVEIILGSENLS
ncbi:MAG: glycosyl hydrolase family 65 protein, partial [Chthoniobacterales bacterium]